MIVPSGELPSSNKVHNDDEKIQIPDPSMEEEQTEKVPIIPASENNDNAEPLIEGAWADILGSGQLKKKVKINDFLN